MGQIQISNEFFKKERNNYTDWPFAFWRELFQNSIDAGAKNIDISTKQTDEDHTFVSFNDDGCGFTSETRDNVFFCLGKTDKGEGTIGGFGKARIVVCFSQHNYQIISQDWRCTGSGSSYEIHPFKGYYKGCSVIVDVDTSDLHPRMKDNSIEVAFIECCLYDYLNTTQMNCRVTINGIVYSGGLHKRRLAKRLSFGYIFTNKSGRFKGYLVVRVSGVTMFKRYIGGSSVQVVLEIDPKNSREVLLSNRDMLHQEYQDELDKFTQMLAVDKTSALRDNYQRFYFYQGSPKITRRKIERKEVPGHKEIKQWQYIIKPKIAAFTVPPRATSTNIPDIKYQDANYKIDALIPSAIVISETRNPKVRRVVSKYNPVNWDDGGGNRKKLLRQWSTICDFVVGEYLGYAKRDELSWRPGFVFSDDSDAMYFMDSTSVACFMLNPVDKDGKIIYGLRSKDSWKKMLIRACHEVSHFVETYHDERFVSLSEKLIELSLFKMDEIFRALLNTLKVDKVRIL